MREETKALRIQRCNVDSCVCWSSVQFRTHVCRSSVQIHMKKESQGRGRSGRGRSRPAFVCGAQNRFGQHERLVAYEWNREDLHKEARGLQKQYISTRWELSTYLDELVQIYAQKLECNAHVVSEIEVI